MARARSLLLLLTLPLVAAACSGNASNDNAQLAKLKAQLASLQQQDQQVQQQVKTAQTQASTEPAVTETTQAGQVQLDSSTVNTTFYFEEFKVTLGKTHVLANKDNPTRATFEIAFTCENITEAEGNYCPSEATIESNKQFYSQNGSDIPQVPAGRSGDGVYRFGVDQKFSLANAVLRVGGGSTHVAVIPLCPSKGSPDTVTLAYTKLPASGTVTAGPTTLTIKGIELRADFPHHRERDKKKLTLLVTVDIDAEPGWYGWLDGNSVSLLRPNGNTSETEAWSYKGVANPENAVHEKDSVLQYEVDNPPAGTYTLQLKGQVRDAENKLQPVNGSATFAIGGAGTASGTTSATTSTTTTSG